MNTHVLELDFAPHFGDGGCFFFWFLLKCRMRLPPRRLCGVSGTSPLRAMHSHFTALQTGRSERSKHTAAELPVTQSRPDIPAAAASSRRGRVPRRSQSPGAGRAGGGRDVYAVRCGKWACPTGPHPPHGHRDPGAREEAPVGQRAGLRTESDAALPGGAWQSPGQRKAFREPAAFTTGRGGTGGTEACPASARPFRAAVLSLDEPVSHEYPPQQRSVIIINKLLP